MIGFHKSDHIYYLYIGKTAYNYNAQNNMYISHSQLNDVRVGSEQILTHIICRYRTT